MYFESRNHNRVKIFDSSEFGYRKVTVDRPLKLNFIVSDERIARLDEQKTFMGLSESKKKKDTQKTLLEEQEGKELQENIKKVLKGMKAELYKNFGTFENELYNAFKKAEIKLAPPIKKAIINALSERDETAEIIRNSKGEPEHDSELRDYEKVPLKEDINQYFEREVKPHIQDAWINMKVRDLKDGQIGKIGYEINFSKYFFEYKPPRTLEEIDKDIDKLQTEILEFLKGATK